jgi:hypothetical protein
VARTVLPVYSISRFSATPDTATPGVTMDVANGNVADNDGYTWAALTLSGGVARTVTVAIPSGFDFDLVVTSRTYPLPSNGVYRTGVFPVSAYGSSVLLNSSGSGVAIQLFTLRTAL